MGPIGYKTSLEETTIYLNKCSILITYTDKNDKVSFVGVTPELLEWYKDFLVKQHNKIFAVEPLDKEDIPLIAKNITDELSLKLYGYTHMEDLQ